jgi:hypothetical protein
MSSYVASEMIAAVLDGIALSPRLVGDISMAVVQAEITATGELILRMDIGGQIWDVWASAWRASPGAYRYITRKIASDSQRSTDLEFFVGGIEEMVIRGLAPEAE